MITFLFYVFVLLDNVDVLSRAGGFGGHGGGFGHSHGSHWGRGNILFFFIIIGWVIYTVITYITVFVNSENGRLFAEKSKKKDALWNQDELKEHANNTFHKLQHAWMNRDMNMASEFVSNSLFIEYQNKLNEMKRSSQKNILSNIDIQSINIIACEDYHDNQKDSYAALIKGSILDYTIDDKSNSITKNPEKEIETFSDIYHFIRQKNRWVLNFVDGEATIFDVLTKKNYREL